ncbi:MAG: hypothetical protein FWD61_16060 [Phycisphaerales bacterium]|nr:hypothetical protein [Phycisphaerales bacterium]
MHTDGDKGAVIQRDKKTFAVAPHFPCGMVTPDQLRKIADLAEKYNAAALKCTSAQRIAIIGIQEQDIDHLWQDLGQYRPGHLIGMVVRSVKVCPGTQFCKRAQQDSLQAGMELDTRYHGKSLPGKMKLGVSGCPFDCSETCIRDIGLVGGRNGWKICVGGCGGIKPRLAQRLTNEEVSLPQALAIIETLFNIYLEHAKKGERFASVIERLTLATVQETVLKAI